MTILRTDDPRLLGRPELVQDLSAVLGALEGWRVLITGAAGSLGSLLAGSLAMIPGVHLSLLDHHEHSLFALQRALATTEGSRAFVLADVRDHERMKRVLAVERPRLIVHLAAYKHVHFGELFPEETIGVNVLATRGLIALAEEQGVERFVYPSSDKAVNAPSLYGATKRIGEVLIRAAAKRGRQYTAVRYMNVLGTRGSVLETFAAQLRDGLPLTVTDAAMTRYWISPREAIWLALESVRAAGGTLLMLDVREEIPVVEMARRLAEQLGPRDTPYPLRFTGIRPGERLREEMLGPHDRSAPGQAPGLLSVADLLLDEHIAQVDAFVDELARLRQHGDTRALHDVAMRAGHGLQ